LGILEFQIFQQASFAQWHQLLREKVEGHFFVKLKQLLSTLGQVFYNVRTMERKIQLKDISV